MRKNKYILFGSISIIILIFDQLLKLFMKSYLSDKSISIIPNFLSFNLVFNTGAGFGILKDQRIFLILISLIVIGAIIYYITKIDENKYIIPLACITGGAIGNMVDRILFGKVTDFIYSGFFPTFNLADSAITIGAIAIIIVSIYEKNKKK